MKLKFFLTQFGNDSTLQDGNSESNNPADTTGSMIPRPSSTYSEDAVEEVPKVS